MKSPGIYMAGGMVILLLGIFTMKAGAQDEKQESKLSVGADLYSNYIWRGSKLATGPSFQPSVSFTAGGFTMGVWGAFDANGYMEADPYISYLFPLGLSLGVTDYYYPDLNLFDVSTDSTGAHALELNAGFSAGGFSINANYIVNEAGGVASAGGDMYFQLGYDFENVSLFVGAGDGWHTSNGKFNVCNIGIGTSKEIHITDKLSVPVCGQVVFNPEKEKLYVVAGFSF